MPALLDVNVLLALLDTRNVNHARARDWLNAHSDSRWASCPLTQNGYLRIAMQSSYSGCIQPHEAIRRLRDAVATEYHVFWEDDVSLLDTSVIDSNRVHGNKQLTDLYLLALAVRHDGRLVTMDQAIPLSVVAGATSRHLVVL